MLGFLKNKQTKSSKKLFSNYLVGKYFLDLRIVGNKNNHGHVARLLVSAVQTLVYLESKPFPNRPRTGPWLSGPEQETRKEQVIKHDRDSAALKTSRETVLQCMCCC